MKKGLSCFLVLFLFMNLAISPSYPQSKIWKLSRDDSRIKFSIKYLMFGKIKGEFHEFDATIISDKPDFSEAEIEINIYTNSIETGNEKRDIDLKSESLFYVEKYPEMVFHGKQIKLVKENIYKISGELSIKDITRKVILDAKYRGKSTAENGQMIAEWQISLVIKRSNFGLKLSRVKEFFADDKVKIDIEASFLLLRGDAK